jgi:predicted transposase YdaD
MFDALVERYHTARKEGRTEGIAVGEKRGQKKRQIEDIKNLSEYGMTPEQIAQALKLPVANVLAHIRES